MAEADLVEWRNFDGYDCRGTVDEREAGKKASLREVSVDPHPELRGNEKHRKREKTARRNLTIFPQQRWLDRKRTMANFFTSQNQVCRHQPKESLSPAVLLET